MLDLLFLLLPIAAAYGWFMGYRSVKKQQEDANNKFSRAYMTGVNFLLSNQTNKAVDLFLDIIQKQEADPDNPDESDLQAQFEAQLTLGNLFRSKGEVDKAIRIHQNLNRSDAYSFEQKLLTKQQLAKDFISVGFYDRAENLYILLVDEPDFAENALQQLTQIYQKTKEWKKAINVAEKLQLLNPQDNNIPLAHYYCEEAQKVLKSDPVASEALLQQALNVSPTCVRASILLAEIAVMNLDYQKALNYFTNTLEQNPDYVSEIILPIQYLYTELGQEENFELFLIRAEQLKNNSAVELALIDTIEQKEGPQAAQMKLYQQIKTNRTPVLFERFIQYQIEQTTDEKSQHSLVLLQKMVNEYIKQNAEYRCTQCGYQSHKLSWCCPSCQQWEGIKPISSFKAIH